MNVLGWVRAVQEDASVGLVRQQLRQFREGMVRDAGQQRAEVRRLVVGTTSRASAIVDETLQVGTWGGVGRGGGNAGCTHLAAPLSPPSLATWLSMPRGWRCFFIFPPPRFLFSRAGLGIVGKCPPLDSLLNVPFPANQSIGGQLPLLPSPSSYHSIYILNTL